MTQTVTITTPPTMSKSQGDPITFKLPFVPKPGLNQTILTLCLIALPCLISLWILSQIAPAFIAVLSKADQLSFTAIAVFSLILLITLFVTVVAFWPAGSWLVMLLARQAVLEIHADGLIDRRALTRKVGWDEFHDLNRLHAFSSSFLHLPMDPSFRLKDGTLRRFSPPSLISSIIFGGKRVAIDTLGFREGPANVSEVIHTMIRNARQQNSAAGSSAKSST